ncbi:MAG: hypothetical protein ACRD2W_21145, partial [Acidimicrobiales bacterium]
MSYDSRVPVEHGFGLAYDLTTMFDRVHRRRTLTLVGCGSDDDDEEAGGGSSTTGGAAPQTT